MMDAEKLADVNCCNQQSRRVSLGQGCRQRPCEKEDTAVKYALIFPAEFTYRARPHVGGTARELSIF